jgi:hypothetical protein
VNDLMADIDRRPVFFERPLDRVDGANDARAKTPRLCKNDAHIAPSMSFAACCREGMFGL